MIPILIYYSPGRGDGRERPPRVASYTRVPSIGEMVEVPAPFDPERTSIWEVRRVVHLRDPRTDGVMATITVEPE